MITPSAAVPGAPPMVRQPDAKSRLRRLCESAQARAKTLSQAAQTRLADAKVSFARELAWQKVFLETVAYTPPTEQVQIAGLLLDSTFRSVRPLRQGTNLVEGTTLIIESGVGELRSPTALGRRVFANERIQIGSNDYVLKIFPIERSCMTTRLSQEAPCDIG